MRPQFRLGFCLKLKAWAFIPDRLSNQKAHFLCLMVNGASETTRRRHLKHLSAIVLYY